MINPLMPLTNDREAYQFAAWAIEHGERIFNEWKAGLAGKPPACHCIYSMILEQCTADEIAAFLKIARAMFVNEKTAGDKMHLFGVGGPDEREHARIAVGVWAGSVDHAGEILKSKEPKTIG